MDGLDKTRLSLKFHAREVADAALLAFHTKGNFHRDNLDQAVERLEKVIAEYKDAKESEQ